MDSDSTLLNAVVGGAVAVVLSFVPFSPVVGGAVAGYLERGDVGDGLRVGALAGLLAAVPLVLFGFVVGGVATLPVGGHGAPAMPGAVGGVLAFVVVAGLVYSVALAAVGGVVGVYLESELDL